MIVWKGETDMFLDWTKSDCPVIPTNMTKFANAGIAKIIRAHTPAGEFERQHIDLLQTGGGLLSFSDGRFAWDLPTKFNINPGSMADPELMKDGLYFLYFNNERLKEHGIDTILLPKIGVGLGHLKWEDVWDDISYWVGRIAQHFIVNVYSEEQRERIRTKLSTRV